jgi:hypothetical protein
MHGPLPIFTTGAKGGDFIRTDMLELAGLSVTGAAALQVPRDASLARAARDRAAVEFDRTGIAEVARDY